MREAIGGTWLFQIVIFFVLLFTAFMCLSINYSKAFNVKNTIVKAIERSGGVDLTTSAPDNETIQSIVNYLNEISYRTTGKCPRGYKGYNRSGVIDSNNSAFCISKKETNIEIDGATTDDLPDMSYYRIIVFFQLDLPIFNELFNFKVTGDTRKVNTSYSKDGVYKDYKNGKCQEYKNGKKNGRPKSCSNYPSYKIMN